MHSNKTHMPRFISLVGRRPLKHAALFVMVSSLFLGAPAAALAAVVIIRVTGVVDQTGIFGRANTNLAGKDYTQVFIVDNTKGTKTVPLGTPPYASHIAATPTSNPMTATITIGTGTVDYGVRPTNRLQIHLLPGSRTRWLYLRAAKATRWGPPSAKAAWKLASASPTRPTQQTTTGIGLGL